ncbi:hypothetical protein [Piscirickettsia salmonis]|uniref:hypothetical protein n=1 Tax=Piscirickettsia salmonis TaxID=1238 RepID=UPI0007C995DE|nr:hypothetical protein A0O36_02492 [Piscirickettsiaceae bacterium NZ-RLO1]
MKLKKITLACGLSALVLSMSSFAGNFSGINYSSTNSDPNTSYLAIASNGDKAICNASATVSNFSYVQSSDSLSFDIKFSNLTTKVGKNDSAETRCNFNIAISPFADDSTYHVESVAQGEGSESEQYPVKITDSNGQEVKTAEPSLVVQAVYNPETNKLSIPLSNVFSAPTSDKDSYNVHVESSQDSSD